MFLKKILAFTSFFVFFCFPSVVSASVMINEIAWMGTLVSGTDEWIELTNTSQNDVDLSGWTLDAEDGSPTIGLAGVIASGGYFLIERTDDDTVPGIGADLVAPFGNGLGNSGETLRLRDANNAIVDTVVGGADWGSIGGNNTTKETPQRVGNTWVVGSPTPRAKNISAGEVLGVSTVNTNTTTNVVPTSSVTGGEVSKPTYSSEVYPRESISARIVGNLHTLVRLPIGLMGEAFGLYDEDLPYASYRWNFGDGATGEGREVTHTYLFPGEYVVTLQVRHSSFEITVQSSVVVTENMVAISRLEVGPDGFVELRNSGGTMVDLSGWQLLRADGAVRFLFPEHSLLTAGKGTLYPFAVTGIDPVPGVQLLLPNGTLVSSTSTSVVVSELSAHGVTVSESQRQAQSLEVPMSSVSSRARTSPLGTSSERSVMSDMNSATDSPVAATVLWERTPVEPLAISSSLTRWGFLLFGLLLLVTAVVLLIRSHVDEPSLADEYAIVEDIIEGVEDDSSRR